MSKLRPIVIALAAVMIAFTAIVTMLVRIPITATGGYLNFSDVATYFAAFAFGPWLGFVSGGIGAAIADILGGYPQFAALTFLAHGLQGLVAGLLSRRSGFAGLVMGWVMGTLVMVSVYLLGEALVMGISWPQALAEVPLNVLQNLVGALVGIPLVYAVRKAYPPITHLLEPRKWHEG